MSIKPIGGFQAISERLVLRAPALAPDAPRSPAPEQDRFTPAKPAAPPKQSGLPEMGATYTIQQGDTLSRIAERMLGDPKRWDEIQALNKAAIPNPNLVSPGMTITLPVGARPSEGAPVAPAPEAKPSSGGPETDRARVYLRQNTNWTCAPTSLTMALAAFGSRPLTYGTVDEMIRLSGANPSVGLPGNASLVASAAKKAGMQATFSSDGSAGAVRAALNRGHGVVLNGAMWEGNGHFIYVAGLRPDGRFIIMDPWRPEITSWSDAELNQFSMGYASNPRGFAEVWR